MQIFLLYLFLFIFGCFIGWIIEVLFRRFFSAKKWVNPGFMKGPWLPLYGFGLITMFTMCYLCITLFKGNVRFYNPLGGLFNQDYTSGPTFYDLIPISLMWISMNLLEFIAGLIFIKGFKTKLWDYTNMKGNIMGIVCPLFSFLWLLVAVIFYYGLNPFIYILSTKVHTYMFGGNGDVAHFGFIFALGLVYGLMVYDLVVSLEVFKRVRMFAQESGIIERYDDLKLKWNNSIKEAKNKLKLDIHLPKVDNTKLKEKFSEMIYIDPKKTKSSNYDENGRPIKEDAKNEE